VSGVCVYGCIECGVCVVCYECVVCECVCVWVGELDINSCLFPL